MDGEGEERPNFLQLKQGKWGGRRERGQREADLFSLSLQSLDLRNKEGWEERESERERVLMALILSLWQQPM